MRKQFVITLPCGFVHHYEDYRVNGHSHRRTLVVDHVYNANKYPSSRSAWRAANDLSAVPATYPMVESCSTDSLLVLRALESAFAGS